MRSDNHHHTWGVKEEAMLQEIDMIQDEMEVRHQQKMSELQATLESNLVKANNSVREAWDNEAKLTKLREDVGRARKMIEAVDGAVPEYDVRTEEEQLKQKEVQLEAEKYVLEAIVSGKDLSDLVQSRRMLLGEVDRQLQELRAREGEAEAVQRRIRIVDQRIGFLRSLQERGLLVKPRFDPAQLDSLSLTREGAAALKKLMEANPCVDGFWADPRLCRQNDPILDELLSSLPPTGSNSPYGLRFEQTTGLPSELEDFVFYALPIKVEDVTAGSPASSSGGSKGFFGFFGSSAAPAKLTKQSLLLGDRALYVLDADRNDITPVRSVAYGDVARLHTVIGSKHLTIGIETSSGADHDLVLQIERCSMDGEGGFPADFLTIIKMMSIFRHVLQLGHLDIQVCSWDSVAALRSNLPPQPTAPPAAAAAASSSSSSPSSSPRPSQLPYTRRADLLHQLLREKEMVEAQEVTEAELSPALYRELRATALNELLFAEEPPRLLKLRQMVRETEQELRRAAAQVRREEDYIAHDLSSDDEDAAFFMKRNVDALFADADGEKRGARGPLSRDELLRKISDFRVCPSLSLSAKKDFIERFLAFDTSGDLLLNKDEAKVALLEVLPQVRPAELMRLIENADVNKDGFLDVIEALHLFEPFLKEREGAAVK